MESPLRQYLEKLHNSHRARFHMPGHKGRGTLSPFDAACPYDITEIAGADSLFEASGILAQGEEATARLYGSKATLWSAGGSTLCIQAMLALVCREGDLVLAVRNAHHAFAHAAILLGVRVRWMLPQNRDRGGLYGAVTPGEVEQMLKQYPQAKAVWVTTPDYLGGMADVKGLARVCHQRGVKLLVDNAHGAYLLYTHRHPMQLGADLCCDSPHKTLPVLTGGAWLHLSHQVPYTADQARQAMKLFGSTSPSYLILLSLEDCNGYLAGSGKEEFARLFQTVRAMRQRLEEQGVALLPMEGDYAKLTLDALAMGYTGKEITGYLDSQKMDWEYADDRFVVLMLSPSNTPQELAALEQALVSLPKREPTAQEQVPYSLPPRRMELRQAYFAPKEEVPIGQAVGRISAAAQSCCPPGVPVVMPGEEITPQVQKLLQKSGKISLDVVQ